MIPATTTVEARDVVTGDVITYDQWVPESIGISSPQDWSDAVATPTSAHVTLRRCRTLPGGKTDRLQDVDALRLKVTPTVHLSVQNIYADATDGGPAFEPTPYPDGADAVSRAQIDVQNAQRKAEYDRKQAEYPAVVKAAVLAALTPLINAAAVLGTARGAL